MPQINGERQIDVPIWLQWLVYIAFAVVMAICIIMSLAWFFDSIDDVECEPEICWSTKSNADFSLGDSVYPYVDKDTELQIFSINADGTKVFGKVYVFTGQKVGDETQPGENRQIWIDAQYLADKPPDWLPVKAE